jgi:transposase
MSNVRRKHTAAFKAKVAIEAVKQEKTTAQLASQFSIHPNLVTQWKKKLKEGVVGIFDDNRGKAKKDDEQLKAELYQQIGRLKVELDWLKKKSEQLHW